MDWFIRILEDPEELKQVEDLQGIIWPGSEIDVVPVHILIPMVQSGGIAVGAFTSSDPGEETKEMMIGFVYGFPGVNKIGEEQSIKFNSHQLGVLPGFEGKGIGFALKRAQWQLTRQTGFDHITWTYDPLLAKNAYLNIQKLGAVSNTYLREYYGEMRDGLNRGMISDRLMVDWWVNSKRVERRLSKARRGTLDLAHFLSAGADILNPSKLSDEGFPYPGDSVLPINKSPIHLVEIPDDLPALREFTKSAAQDWRYQAREILEELFNAGYYITDFTRIKETPSRSFYVLSHGELTL